MCFVGPGLLVGGLLFCRGLFQDPGGGGVPVGAGLAAGIASSIYFFELSRSSLLRYGGGPEGLL